jgi:hypothetical protein
VFHSHGPDITAYTRPRTTSARWRPRWR